MPAIRRLLAFALLLGLPALPAGAQNGAQDGAQNLAATNDIRPIQAQPGSPPATSTPPAAGTPPQSRMPETSPAPSQSTPYPGRNCTPSRPTS